MAINKKRGKKRGPSKREIRRIALMFSIVVGTALFVAVVAEVWYRTRTGNRHHVSFVSIWFMGVAAVWIAFEIGVICRHLLHGKRRSAKR